MLSQSLHAGTVVGSGSGPPIACDGSLPQTLLETTADSGVGRSLGLDDSVLTTPTSDLESLSVRQTPWPESADEAGEPAEQPATNSAAAPPSGTSLAATTAKWLGVLGCVLLLLGKTRRH